MCRAISMDYDSTSIPAGYDRSRDHGPEVIELWMDRVEASIGALQLGAVCDLGCGTGRFTDALAKRFGAIVIGLDPSEKMLRQARTKPHRGRVHYVRGGGEAIPLANGSVDAVFISMAIHHFSNADGAARECRRILSPGGALLVRTGTRDQIPNYPYVPFFPPSLPLLEMRLPTAENVQGTFRAAGFKMGAFHVVVQTIAPTVSSYADKLAAGGDSILASLSSEDFESGLAAIRAHASLVDPRPVSEPIDFFVFR
jgi:ubiquinone/menaquinone biosynthesis C-methylase UbiE